MESVYHMAPCQNVRERDGSSVCSARLVPITKQKPPIFQRSVYFLPHVAGEGYTANGGIENRIHVAWLCAVLFPLYTAKSLKSEVSFLK